MTNKERQKRLDITKYLDSKESGEDLSGSMAYCMYCECKEDGCKCLASQDEREALNMCAIAYNRMIRGQRK